MYRISGVCTNRARFFLEFQRDRTPCEAIQDLLSKATQDLLVSKGLLHARSVDCR